MGCTLVKYFMDGALPTLGVNALFLSRHFDLFNVDIDVKSMEKCCCNSCTYLVEVGNFEF